MASRAFHVLTIFAVSLWILGCADEGRVYAGFSATWVLKSETGQRLTCEDIRAEWVRFDITDADGARHPFDAPCRDYAFETAEWEIAVGTAQVAVTVRGEGNETSVLAAAEPFAVSFVSGAVGNRLPEIVLVSYVDGPEPAAPRWDFSVSLQDESGEPVVCQQIGAAFLSFTAEDSDGRVHFLGSAPCRPTVAFGVQLEEAPSAGPAQLEIAFRDTAFRRFDQIDVVVDVLPGDAVYSLTLPVAMRTTGGDAGLTWRWTRNGDPLDEQTCAALGIDYGRVYVFDTNVGSWWTESELLTAPCAAFDHPADEAVFGSESYAGIFSSAFLPAGDHRLSLVLFRRSSGEDGADADVAVYFDEAVPGDTTGLSGTLLATPPDRTNLLVSEVGEILTGAGTLSVHLDWESPHTGTVGDCSAAGVAVVGAALQSDFGPAASLSLSEPGPCTNRLLFSGLPRLPDNLYTLIVYGLNDDGAMKWYDRCDALMPESVGADGAPSGYWCIVEAALPAL